MSKFKWWKKAPAAADENKVKDEDSDFNGARQDVSTLYISIDDNQLPIIYRPEYNVHFAGLEKLHPFDAAKWGNIFQYLKDAKLVDEKTITRPNKASDEDLLQVHSKKYLKSLKKSWNVAKIAEIPPLAFVPNKLVQKSYLSPMRYQVGGSILAGKLALEKGWAINIGGGFHHCSAEKGGGFCPYADITLLIQALFTRQGDVVKTAMILDLDAHQGNGHERDFLNDKRVYIVDMYNKGIYPRDNVAKEAITKRIELFHLTEDDEYLTKVEINTKKSLREFKPSILVYNAGTDILEGDPLGLLSISSYGIIRRDEIVFASAREERVPIVMLTSGGYQRKTARIIADSILNLHEKGLLTSLPV